MYMIFTISKEGVTMRSTDQKIRIVDATMTMEGMPLTSEDKTRLRNIFDGTASVERIAQDLVAKHSQPVRKVHEQV